MGFWSIALPLVSAGASLFGAKKSSDASKEAANIQANATADGIAENRRQFDVTQNNLKPFLKRGNEAGNELSNLLLGRTTFDPNDTPGFTASLNEGLKATEKSAFARGQGLSGRTLALLQDLGQKYSYGAYNNRINQLAGLAGTGQTAGNTLGFIGGNSSSQIGSLLTQGGNARASGVIGSNNAFQSGLENTIKSLEPLFNSNNRPELRI